MSDLETLRWQDVSADTRRWLQENLSNLPVYLYAHSSLRYESSDYQREIVSEEDVMMRIEQWCSQAKIELSRILLSGSIHTKLVRHEFVAFVSQNGLSISTQIVVRVTSNETPSQYVESYNSGVGDFWVHRLKRGRMQLHFTPFSVMEKEADENIMLYNLSETELAVITT